MTNQMKVALININGIRSNIHFNKKRSAWDRGVAAYADELLDNLEEAVRGGWVDLDDLYSRKTFDRAMLNGADDWSVYSWGGCSLIYDGDIAERLCNPTELKRTDFGRKAPNKNEQWLDVQARALYQAAALIKSEIVLG